jgi:hypothetical protein
MTTETQIQTETKQLEVTKIKCKHEFEKKQSK